MAVVLPVSETVTVTELDSDVAVCASAKEVTQLMTMKLELIMAMMCAEYYGADIKLIKLIIVTWTFGTNIFSTIKVKHCCRKHMCTARHDIHIWLSFQIRSDLAKSDH